MPELPEVETVLRTLQNQICDREIISVKILYPKIVENDPEDFIRRMTHQHFRGFHRRGKYLIFEMDDLCFISHLRMEGKYYLQQPEEPYDRHTHVIFQLNDGRQLRYHDTRKFGRMELAGIDTDFSHWHGLGPEPFDENFNASYIHKYIQNRNIPLKTLLLNQSFVAGIGNIYADEILAACHLRPGRSCRRITRKDEENIVNMSRSILKAAIAAGGTTIRSYTSSLGVTGRFQLECSVHAQKKCARCGHDIHVKWIGGRSSYYCPICQK